LAGKECFVQNRVNALLQPTFADMIYSVLTHLNANVMRSI